VVFEIKNINPPDDNVIYLSFLKLKDSVSYNQ